MFTRRFYTLGYVLIAVGVLLFLSFLPIGYVSLFVGLSDTWGGVALLNLPTGLLVFWVGVFLAGEL